jgi:hypothetical protein
MSSIITFTYCSKWNHLIYKTLDDRDGLEVPSLKRIEQHKNSWENHKNSRENSWENYVGKSTCPTFSDTTQLYRSTCGLLVDWKTKNGGDTIQVMVVFKDMDRKKMCPYLSISLSLYTHFGYFVV